MQETQVRSLSQEDPLKKGMVTHSSILTWRIPWTEKPGGLQPMGSQSVRHDWPTNTCTFIIWAYKSHSWHKLLYEKILNTMIQLKHIFLSWNNSKMQSSELRGRLRYYQNGASIIKMGLPWLLWLPSFQKSMKASSFVFKRSLEVAHFTSTLISRLGLYLMLQLAFKKKARKYSF